MKKLLLILAVLLLPVGVWGATYYARSDSPDDGGFSFGFGGF